MQSLFVLTFLVFNAAFVAADDGECAICVRVLDEIRSAVPAAAQDSYINFDEQIDAYCKKHKKGEERKICYGIETVKRDVSKPMANGLPTDVICKKLQKKYGTVCTVKAEEKIDLRTVDLKSMKVKQLKSILADHDLSCKGCAEKSAFIKMIEKEIIAKLPPAEGKKEL